MGKPMQYDIRNSLQPVWQCFLDFIDAASLPTADTAARALLDRGAAALRALDAMALANIVSTAHESGQLADAIRIAHAVARLAPERADAQFATAARWRSRPISRTFAIISPHP
jgi:hypothetical protein